MIQITENDEQASIVSTNNPKWAKFRKDMQISFPSPYKCQDDSLTVSIDSAIHELNKLKPEDSGGSAYLGVNPALTIDFDNVKKSVLNQAMSTSGEVIANVIKMFEGLPNWGHPLTMCNVNPQGNTAAIIAAVLSEIFAPNILEGEYAWNIHQAELESGGILANLAGWKSEEAGCVYTYGGSGCWTYHLKYALTRVL